MNENRLTRRQLIKHSLFGAIGFVTRIPDNIVGITSETKPIDPPAAETAKNPNLLSPDWTESPRLRALHTVTERQLSKPAALRLPYGNRLELRTTLVALESRNSQILLTQDWSDSDTQRAGLFRKGLDVHIVSYSAAGSATYSLIRFVDNAPYAPASFRPTSGWTLNRPLNTAEVNRWQEGEKPADIYDKSFPVSEADIDVIIKSIIDGNPNDRMTAIFFQKMIAPENPLPAPPAPKSRPTPPIRVPNGTKI